MKSACSPFAYATARNREAARFKADDPALDILLSLLILAVLLALAMSYQLPLVAKTRTTAGTAIWTIHARQEIAAFHAETGRWANYEDIMLNDASSQGLQGFGLRAVQIKNGSINVVLEDQGRSSGLSRQQNLSLLRHRHRSGTPILWSCGTATLRSGQYLDAPPNLTDIDPELLPRNCRADDRSKQP